MGANLERVMGIEPTRPAWKAGILPLNYTRIRFSAFILYHLVSHLSRGFRNFFIIFNDEKFDIKTTSVRNIQTEVEFYVIGVNYLTTMLMILPGTTISFTIVFPSIAAFTFSSLITSVRTSSLLASFGAVIRERTLPLI